MGMSSSGVFLWLAGWLKRYPGAGGEGLDLLKKGCGVEVHGQLALAEVVSLR
jgi:hypothetical protein